MSTYILKRILLMIPTLFLIILLTFLILNLAPGQPGQKQGGKGGQESTSSLESQESYRIFREQFNLDKPVLWNTRYLLGKRDVQPMLETVAASRRPICARDGSAESKAPKDCIPIEKRPESEDVIDAQRNLLDYGAYIVPELLSIAEEHSSNRVRGLALRQLSQNAKFELKNQFGKYPTKAEKQFNKRVKKINRKIEKWKPDGAVPDDQTIDSLLEDKWLPWYKEHRDRFNYSLHERAGITFADTRFFKYIQNLATLNFGISHVDKKPVLETIAHKIKYSLTLSFISILLAYLISVPLGVWSAYNQHTMADQVVTVILFLLYSLPSFFTAVILVDYLAVDANLFPVNQFVGSNPETMTTLEYVKSVAWHLVLPVFCLTYVSLAALSRYARTGILDVIRADYIRTARAKGLSEGVVVIKHAVRNGMIPVLTLLGTLLPRLIGGSVVLEAIFDIPGMGLYLLTSIQARDYNALMGVLLISSVLTLIGILISDISYALVDPRISFDDE